MSEKRKLDYAKVPPGSKRRKFPSLRSVITEVIRLQSIKDFLEPALEPLVRRVVKEEVCLALKKHLGSTSRTCLEKPRSSGGIKLKLQFLNRVSLPIFTGTRIEGEGCSAIEIALVDSVTGQLVRSGPEASARIEIVVLEGDFDSDEEDDWTLEEFESNIVREREGKKSLLVGDVSFKLKDGVGSVGDFWFSDNSSWTRSRRFKLGARVTESKHGIRVKEAKTLSFAVRDHRGESYKKHYPPSFEDEVWRLEKIGKDGAFHKRLVRENVNTVKDFLTLLSLDPSRLRNVLGAGMSSKMWESTVDHARTCMVVNKFYLYHPPSQAKVGVVFDAVGQVSGLHSGNHYIPINNLSSSQMMDAHDLVVEAFQNWNDVTHFDSPCPLNPPYSVPNDLYDSGSSVVGSSSTRENLLSIGEFDYGSTLSDMLPSLSSAGCDTGLDDCYLPGTGSISLGYDPLGSTYADQYDDSLVCGVNDPVQFLEPHHSQCQNTGIEMEPAVSSFLLSRPAAVAAAHRRWRKVFCILKWFSVRKLVTAKSKNVG